MTEERGQFWVILLIVFLGFIGVSIPYLIFPALFLNPEFTILASDVSAAYRAIFLGIALAAYPFGQFIGSPILGSLSDDYGRKPLLSGSLVVAGLCNAATGIAIGFGSLWLLIGSRFLAGLMEGNIAIARAMAADLTSISKHEGFGKINAAASIAFLIGPLIGGIMTDKTLFEEFTTSTPFYLICLLFLFLAGLSALVLQKGNAVSEKSARSFLERINIIQRMKKLFTNERLRFLMITSTCFTLAVDIFYEFGPVYLTVKWTLDPADLVIYNALLCLALAVGNGWLPGFIFQKVSSSRAIIYSLGGFALFLSGMLVSDVPHLMMFIYIFSGLVIGLGVTLLTVKISNSVSETIQGEVMGVQLSLRVLGDAVICLLGGALLLISSKVILMVAAVLSLIAMGYYVLRLSN